MLVREHMSRKLVTLTPDTEVLRALHTLAEHNVSGAPVVDDDGRLVGILTEKDCLKCAVEATYHSEYGGLVADFMSEDVITMDPDESIMDAAKHFAERRYHRYPVVEEGALVGIISRRDVITALSAVWQWQ